MGYSMYIRTSPEGVVIGTKVASRPPGTPWVLVTRDMGVAYGDLRDNSARYRFTGYALELLPEVRLSIDAPVVYLDGQDTLQVELVAIDPVDTLGDISIAIDGEEGLIAPGEIIEFTPQSEGTYSVELLDRRVYAKERVRQFVAVVPMEEP